MLGAASNLEACVFLLTTLCSVINQTYVFIPSTFKLKEKVSSMVNFPKCDKKLMKTDKKLENSVFFVAVFTCDECEKQLAVTH